MFKRMNDACNRFEQRVYESPVLTAISAAFVVVLAWAMTCFLAAILS